MLTRKAFLKAVLAAAAVAGTQSVWAQTVSKTFVLYYSKTGNTQGLAELLAKELHADIARILPVEPYPENYRETVNLAREQLNSGARPAIQKTIPDLSAYNTILLGTPNWWSHVSMPVFTFMDEYDLSGKVILPFVTHGGGGMSHCEEDIRAKFPKADVRRGLAVYGSSYDTDEVRAWLKENKLLE